MKSTLQIAAPSDAEEARLDRLFKALGHRTRRRLLASLAQGPARITDLVEPDEMTFAAVSKHIRVLEDAGLIERTVDGRNHRCALKTEPLAEAEDWLGHYRPFWTSTLDALADHLEKP